MYNDEQLSRILSEHAAYRLREGGSQGHGAFATGDACCIEEAANNKSWAEMRSTLDGDRRAANWFDSEYFYGWSEDEFLRQLERKGLA